MPEPQTLAYVELLDKKTCLEKNFMNDLHFFCHFSNIKETTDVAYVAVLYIWLFYVKGPFIKSIQISYLSLKL